MKNGFVIFILFLSSCASNTPFHTHTYLYDKESKQNNILVFLPGTGGSLNDLKNEGLLDSLLANKPAIDIVTVNATFEYYMNRTLVPRLEKEIISAAKAEGYNSVWLLGNSVGSLGALLYARRHPGEIRGIILLGPFLGDKPIVSEIMQAGGAKTWIPKDSTSDNYQRDLWVYLKECSADTTSKFPSLFLLAGREDRFHEAHLLLADLLKPEQIFWAKGGHDWNAWRSAFGSFVKQDVPGIFNDFKRTIK